MNYSKNGSECIYKKSNCWKKLFRKRGRKVRREVGVEASRRALKIVGEVIKVIIRNKELKIK